MIKLIISKLDAFWSLFLFSLSLSLKLPPMKHGHFKTLDVSVSDTCRCPTHWGHSCMRVLIVLEGKKNIYLFKKVYFNYKYVFKDFDNCYLC
jgi:hypothetical protein